MPNHKKPGLSKKPHCPPLPPITDKKGGNVEEFPADLRVRQFPDDVPNIFE